MTPLDTDDRNEPGPGSSRYWDDSLEVLLVEDDPDDALIFEKLLRPEVLDLRITRATTIGEATRLLESGTRPDVCVLDLGLPDCAGLEALEKLQQVDSDLPTIVLTGEPHGDIGPQAVRLGAQDYLLKGRVLGAAIARSIRFAIERRNNERSVEALTVAEATAREQARMEASLIARPSLRSQRVQFESRYVASRPGALGGDFLDCVQIDDRFIRCVVGDVAGHGTYQAALGVTLRAGWRSLALDHPPDHDIFPALENLLVSERRSEFDFVTVVGVVIDLAEGTVQVRCAGHPPPFVTGLGLIDDRRRCRPLGIMPLHTPSAGTVHQIGDSFSLVLYTDGLFERRRADGLIGNIDDVEQIFTDAGSDLTVEKVLRTAAKGSGPWRDDVAIARLEVLGATGWRDGQ